MRARARGMIAALLVPLSWTAPADASPADWDQSSGIVRTGLVAFSLGVPAFKQDWHGLGQDAGALAVAGGTTFALKSAVRERRPDGSGDNSFPSGHTSISFAAAAGLEQRYGWKVGVPAHLAAAFVGLARVEADKHYWHDVIVGAVIGEAAGLLLVHRRDRRHEPAPIGASFSMAF